MGASALSSTPNNSAELRYLVGLFELRISFPCAPRFARDLPTAGVHEVSSILADLQVGVFTQAAELVLVCSPNARTPSRQHVHNRPEQDVKLLAWLVKQLFLSLMSRGWRSMCQVRVGRQHVTSLAALAGGSKVEGSNSDQASLGGNSLLDCVVYAWFTPAVAEGVSQDLRFCVVVDGDVVQLLVQNCTRLWLPVFKKSLDSSCFKQLSVMSHFSSAQQLEIVRVVETSSDAAGEGVSQDLWFCDVSCSMELAVPQWSWTCHARCRPADGEGSLHGMVDALGFPRTRYH